MFDKILVANRGEIAVRVIRAIHELGAKAVAVYSEADADAVHVRCADEAYPIGPAPSAESYLVVEKILDVAAKSGAQAIHPGYGFLSENANFARSVSAAGLVWIGPPPEAIEAMGEKTLARATMEAAGVPVVPGSGAIEDPLEALAFAENIGYPVLVKASAGGGGKGMRRVDDSASFVAAFEGAQREALAAFGDGTVYVEKFVVQPKHIEIQLLSDTHGTHLHLFERDCSIQRRHQKVIEETPCAVIRDDVRMRMGEVATRAARAVDYVGAGTVEFLLDVNQEFYFLEMNTRLQVEHPITEMVTGMDLVHWQIRIAAGEKLPFVQSDLRQIGSSIECRVYAEDPHENFRPSPGTIEYLSPPSGPWIRDDSGVVSGSEVSMFYDPMISKLVVWAADRPTAIARMRNALRRYIIRGLQTNLDYHEAILTHPAFIDGTYDTQLLTRSHEEILSAVSEDPELVDLAAVAAVIAAYERDNTATSGQGNTSSSSAKNQGNPWKMYGRYKQLQKI